MLNSYVKTYRGNTECSYRFSVFIETTLTHFQLQIQLQAHTKKQ